MPQTGITQRGASGDIAVQAQRLLRAAEAASLPSLERQLTEVEAFEEDPDERLELLGAIASDMRAALGSKSPGEHLLETLEPHLHLLRHLSRANVWVN